MSDDRGDTRGRFDTLRQLHTEEPAPRWRTMLGLGAFLAVLGGVLLFGTEGDSAQVGLAMVTVAGLLVLAGLVGGAVRDDG